MFSLHTQQPQSESDLLEPQTCRNLILFSQYEIDLNDNPKYLPNFDQQSILQQVAIDLALCPLKKASLLSTSQAHESQNSLIDICIQQEQTTLPKCFEKNKQKNNRKLIFSKTDKLWMYHCLQNIHQQFQDDQFKFYLKKVSSSLKTRWASTISNILRFKTNKFSKLRLLPDDVIHKVIQYSGPSDHYIIENISNRSRVELTSINSGYIELKQNLQYFLRERGKQSKKVILRIQKILLGCQSYGVSIGDHNTKASDIINEYIESVTWSSQDKLQKTIILNDLHLEQFKDFRSEKIDILVFRVEIAEFIKKCFLVALRSSARKTVNLISLFTPNNYLNNQQFYGMISHQNNKWMIKANENNLTMEDKLWISLKHNQPFIVNKQQEYLIKFQRFPNILQLQFRNESE